MASSILPDVDAPRSPVHDTMLVFLGILVTIIMQRFGFISLVLLVTPFSIMILITFV